MEFEYAVPTAPGRGVSCVERPPSVTNLTRGAKAPGSRSGSFDIAGALTTLTELKQEILREIRQDYRPMGTRKEKTEIFRKFVLDQAKASGVSMDGKRLSFREFISTHIFNLVHGRIDSLFLLLLQIDTPFSDASSKDETSPLEVRYNTKFRFYPPLSLIGAAALSLFAADPRFLVCTALIYAPFLLLGSLVLPKASHELAHAYSYIIGDRAVKALQKFHLPLKRKEIMLATRVTEQKVYAGTGGFLLDDAPGRESLEEVVTGIFDKMFQVAGRCEGKVITENARNARKP